jgi:DNA primase
VSDFDLSRPVLDRVREAADIVQVVGEHVSLRKAGRNYVGLCPFHGEKTPSFNVSREKGTYYCFGCKRGGDAIDFVMELDRLPFADAVERLAERFGVTLPLASPTARRRHDEAGQLTEVLDAAQLHFARQIGGDRPRAFLERRGLSLEVAAEFGLGYAPAGWRVLYDTLQRRFPERLLKDAGLIVDGEGGRVWDRFRDRVTIPIRSARSKIVGFGGRSVGEETPKYLNSPETQLFSKSQLLFLLDRAMQAFARLDRAIVVEGYFDAIALHRAGFAETVATLGTSLSDHHARELARRAKRVIICYDGDDAGRSAAIGALRTILAAGLDVAVLLLPDGQDPDDIVRREGGEGFARRVEGALATEAFLVHTMGSSRQERRSRLLATLEIVDVCPDPVRRYGLREALARSAGVPVEELGADMVPRLALAQRIVADMPPAGELALLRGLLVDVPQERRRDLLAGLSADALDHPASRAILGAVLRRAREGATLEISGVTSDIEEHDVRRILAALEHEAPFTDEQHLALIMRELCEKQRTRRLAELSLEIARAEREGQPQELARLLHEKQSLLRKNGAR